MQSGKFRLPGKKQLYQNAYTWSVVVVDVTESPIERPKKQQGYYTDVDVSLPVGGYTRFTQMVTRKAPSNVGMKIDSCKMSIIGVGYSVP